MRVAGKSSKPTFFWQGVLILLPVMVMAAFGIRVILRERTALEQDARQRGQEVLQALLSDFEQRLALRIGFSAQQSPRKTGIPENAAAVTASEADGAAQQWGAAGNLVTNKLTASKSTNSWCYLRGHIITWTYPSDQVWPMNFLLDTNGNFWDLTYQEAPQPPVWFTKMSDHQRKAWNALRESDLDKNAANGISRRVDDFLSTAPPEPARQCAEFIRLRAESASNPDRDALDSLLGFATNCPDAEMDTGLPLSNLVMAELLRRAHPGALNRAIQMQLEFEVRYRPSLLIPALLDQAEHFASSDSAFAESLKQLRAICRTRELQRGLAEQIKLTGIHCPVGTITNFWIQAEEWFCVLQPYTNFTGHLVPTGSANRINADSTNVFSEIIPFPAPFLAKSFAESLDDAHISLPDNFALTAELGGEGVGLPTAWDRNVMITWYPGSFSEMLRFSKGRDILAEQQVFLPLPATHSLNDKTEEDFHGLSDPRIIFNVVLKDHTLLYARQRLHQAIFGGLIGFSVAAALVGFFSARRAFYTQLQLSDAKSNFVSSVSHELRAPIASVRLMAESLERGKVQESQKQNQYFQFIVQECRRLSSLIENVLDFSRIEQGRKQYEFEPTDLAALVHETVKLMEPYAAERGVIMKMSPALEVADPGSAGVPPASPNTPPNTATGDPEDPSARKSYIVYRKSLELELDGRAIQQALVNLIDNAIKHSPKGQIVTVGLAHNDSRTGVSPVSNLNSEAIDNVNSIGERQSETGKMPVLLYVEDHGPGIPPEEHEKIFERFYRLGSELRRETQGVGIGLSIVKHIVEAHGGHVTVRSNPGHGSRFTIELPAINAKTPGSKGAKDL